MPDILVCLSQQDWLREVESILGTHEIRAKITLTKEDCLQWVEQRSFHLLLLDGTMDSNDIQTIASAAWKENALCRIVVVVPEGESAFDSLLFGTEIIQPKDLESLFTQAVEVLIEENQDFHALQHVLVVEDLDAPRDIICLFLEGLGVKRISSANSAAAALEMLAANPNAYTTILTDIRMPAMTGDELIHEVRHSAGTARIPIIVLTAHGTMECLIDCLRAGATGFLVKPPKKEDMLRELERAERLRRSGASVRLLPANQVEAFITTLEQRK